MQSYYLFTIIIIVIVSSSLLLAYRKFYTVRINSSVKKRRVMDLRTFSRLILLFSSLGIVITFVIIPKYNYEYNYDNTFSFYAKLDKKLIYYENTQGKEGYYLVVEPTKNEHKILYGDTIEVKIDKQFDDFAYNSLIIENEYFISLSYKGHYETFLDAYADTTIYLVNARVYPSETCIDYETSKICESSTSD